MTVQVRYTSADLDELPDIPGVRYEIIDGSLYVSKATRWEHENAAFMVAVALHEWDREKRAGRVILTPGLIFAPEQDVIPDLIWISFARMAALVDEGGHFRGAPELVVEVLSPGRVNEQRDREVKLSLYSRQGVEEYWIVDWRTRTVELYRRDGAELRLAATLRDEESITSPLFPGFSCPITNLWVPSVR
jgi:Uma2 family endonuclease